MSSDRIASTARTQALIFEARPGADTITAAAGPVCTDSCGLDRSRVDRVQVEAVRFPAWSSLAWEFVVIDKTERLVRSEPFRRLHRRVVAALDELGDTGTLSGDALERALTTPRLQVRP